MRRPDVMKREDERKKSPKYKAWQKKYIHSDRYKELAKKREQKKRLMKK